MHESGNSMGENPGEGLPIEVPFDSGASLQGIVPAGRVFVEKNISKIEELVQGPADVYARLTPLYRVLLICAVGIGAGSGAYLIHKIRQKK